MNSSEAFKLAAIQAAPVYFDREASTAKACGLIAEAGRRGAVLAAFGESWLPGYPFFVWEEATADAAVQYLANAVDIPGPTTDRLCLAAREAGVDVVIGVAERETDSHGTVYCTLLFISREGTILGRHRKLKPTHRERTAWGEGDGSTLVTHQRPYGKLSGLNCWEHNMVLPGYALMAQGTRVHVAAWPGMSTSRHLFLSRAFASQAGAFVIDVGGLLSPDDVTGPAGELAGKSAYPGESHIIDPRGEIMAGPAVGEEILLADCTVEQVLAAKTRCDVAGHYSRPDVFRLHVNRTPHRRVVEMTDPDPGSDGPEAESEA